MSDPTQTLNDLSFDDFFKEVFRREPTTITGEDGDQVYCGDADTAHRVWWKLKNDIKRCEIPVIEEAPLGLFTMGPAPKSPEEIQKKVRRITSEWLKHRIETDPDLPCEIGGTHCPACKQSLPAREYGWVHDGTVNGMTYFGDTKMSNPLIFKTTITKSKGRSETHLRLGLYDKNCNGFIESGFPEKIYRNDVDCWYQFPMPKSEEIEDEKADIATVCP